MEEVRKLIFGRYILKKSNKGSMMLEAAIFLPLFIVAVAMLGCLVKAIWLNVLVVEAGTDQVRQYCTVDTIVTHKLAGDIFGPPNIFILDSKVENALEREGLEKGKLHILPALLKAPSSDDKAGSTKYHNVSNGSFTIRLNYDVDMNFPKKFVDKLGLKKYISARKWIGLKYDGQAFSFSEMQQNGKGSIVAIFPNAGECYHDLSCRVVMSNKEAVSLNNSVRRKYSQCPLCCEGDEVNGQTVYVFKYGSCYHEAECPSVSKYYVTMDVEDAVSRNYRVCNVCGG